MNVCCCGYYSDPVKQCTCTSSIITRYQKRISGPLLDHIDIHVEVPRVEYEKLSDNRAGETSCAIRARVEAARKRQRERFAHTEEMTCNSGYPLGEAPGRDPRPVRARRRGPVPH